MPDFLDRGLVELLLTLDHRQHFSVEIAEIMVAQFLVVHQVPLSAGIFIAPAVSFPREVYPFRMTELIAHEVQVTSVDGRCRGKPYHLVQGYAAVYHLGLVALAEVPVHIGIYQTEDDGLVAYQCLVV